MPIPLLLHGKHQRPGAPPVVYEPSGAWIVPWRFGDLDAEYRAMQGGAALIDDSTQTVIECRGADRASFLQRLLTNDIARLTPGTGCRAALLNEAGKLIAELLVLAEADMIRLLCDLTIAPRVMQTLEHHHIAEELTLTDRERAFAVLAVEGPGALGVIGRLSGTAIPLPTPLAHAAVSLEGVTVRVIKHSLLNREGVWCLVEAAASERIWRLLADSGAVPAGWEAFHIARIEAGVPLFGVDMDGTNLLPETGLETVLCHEAKGCYLGQEVIARLATYGSLSKRLMGLLVDAAEIPQAGDRIGHHGEEEAGWVTSGCRSRALGQPIAMGYVKRGAYAPGTVVQILRGECWLPATVTTLASIARTRAGG
ncbi:MAG: aminomethyl transferase family protein [Candidatus Omnitrophica bacterium]|nr:aminomethyl transferase family protein [Candidatus Omnitrophota bacterium]